MAAFHARVTNPLGPLAVDVKAEVVLLDPRIGTALARGFVNVAKQ